MALIEFIEKAGNKVWINDESVEAVGSLYSDGTETGVNPAAKLLTYVLLKSGNTIHLDQGIESVIRRLHPAI